MNLTRASIWNVGTYGLMLREKFKWENHKNESTDAVTRGRLARSSDEVSVMEMERRG